MYFKKPRRVSDAQSDIKVSLNPRPKYPLLSGPEPDSTISRAPERPTLPPGFWLWVLLGVGAALFIAALVSTVIAVSKIEQKQPVVAERKAPEIIIHEHQPSPGLSNTPDNKTIVLGGQPSAPTTDTDTVGEDEVEEKPIPIAAFQRASNLGAVITSPAVLSAQGLLHRDQVMTGYASLFDAPNFENVITRLPADNCSFRRIKTGEKPYNISVNMSFPKAPIMGLTHARIGDALQNLGKEIIKDGSRKFALHSYFANGQMGLVNVYVTDTAQPVYLVLQADNVAKSSHQLAGTIWNLHLAPGVEIAHIQIVSNTGAGLMLPKGTDASYSFSSRWGLDPELENAPCLPHFMRRPNAEWAAFQNAEDDYRKQDRIDKFFQHHAKFEVALQNATGISSLTNLLSPAVSDHILVGPIPATPIPYQTSQSTDLILDPFDHVFFGSRDEIGAETSRLHMAILDKIGSTDITAYRPAILAKETSE